MRAFAAMGRMPGLRARPATIPVLTGVCVSAMFGAFVLAALMLARLERSEGQTRTAGFAARQADELAAVAAANLNRLAAEGAAYAADPGNLPRDPALINIAVFGKDGALLALLHRKDIPSRPPYAKARRLFAE